MTCLQAAFTFTRPLSEAHIEQVGQDAALFNGLEMHHLHVGTAGNWGVLLARLEPSSILQAQQWLTHLLEVLEAEQDAVELFRVEIDQTEPHWMACLS